MKFSTLPLALSLATGLHTTSAHYFFPHLIVDGVKSAEYVFVRRSTQGFQPHFADGVLDTADMRCNTGAQANADATRVATVRAGDIIAFGTNLEAKIQHPGPVAVYMSRAPGDNVQVYDGSGDWFKIFQMGATFPMLPSGDNWLVWNMSAIEFSIPREVTAGQYLVRIEHVALHRPSGTELYFNCAHLQVENDDPGLVPQDTVKIPGVYGYDSPGLSPQYSIYSGANSYPFPGPAVFPVGGESPAAGSSASPVVSASSVAPPPPATTTASPISSSTIAVSIGTTISTPEALPPTTLSTPVRTRTRVRRPRPTRRCMAHGN